MKDQWIKVESSLPAAGKLVLFLRRNGAVLSFGYKAYNDPFDHWWTDLADCDRDGCLGDVFDVTHWYPIPPWDEP